MHVHWFSFYITVIIVKKITHGGCSIIYIHTILCGKAAVVYWIRCRIIILIVVSPIETSGVVHFSSLDNIIDH